MRDISLNELKMVVGGSDSDIPRHSDDGGAHMTVVTISATSAQVSAARTSYKVAQTAANMMSGFAGAAAAGAVTGACALTVAAVAGPPAGVVAVKPCAVLGAPVGIAVGAKTSQILNHAVNKSY
jgi:hypothetical protein